MVAELISPGLRWESPLRRGEVQGQLPCRQQSGRGRPNSPVRAGQTLSGAGPAQHGPWTSAWLWVAAQTTGILMAFGGNRDHRHQHRSLATMEPPRKKQRSRHHLAPGGSAAYSHQPLPHHNSVSSPTSPQRMSHSVSLLSHFSTTCLLIAVVPGG